MTRTGIVTPRSKALEVAMQSAWQSVFVVPGLPLKRSRRTTVLFGGFWFWLIIGAFWLIFWAIVVYYAIVVVAIRVLAAILVTLVWAVVLGWERIHRIY